MKHAQHILLAGILFVSAATFAAGPALPDSTFIEDSGIVSGEVNTPNPPISLFSAPDEPNQNTMSGEINITIPYNPDEVDKATSWTPDEPRNINLNSASHVQSGPALNILLALVLSLMISGLIYVRAKPHLK